MINFKQSYEIKSRNMSDLLVTNQNYNQANVMTLIMIILYAKFSLSAAFIEAQGRQTKYQEILKKTFPVTLYNKVH